MKATLVLVFIVMVYAAFPGIAHGDPAESRDGVAEANRGRQAVADDRGHGTADEPGSSGGHHGQAHSEPQHGEAHGDPHAPKTDHGAKAQDHGAGAEGHDAGHGEDHGGHKEAFLFRVREAYTRKKGELRVGFDFGYIRGKERLEAYEFSGFRKKHVHKERIRYGDYEYLLKLDYGITDRIQVTGIVPYFSIREHIEGEPYLGKSHLGDSKVEVWYNFVEEDEHKPAISGAFQLTLPTGDYKKGIGNERVGYGGLLAITKDFGNSVLYGDLGYNLTPGAKINWSDRRDSSHHDLHGFSYGVGAVFKLPDTWRFSIEVAGKTLQEIELDDTDWATQLAVIPGLRKSVDLGKLGVLEYGVGFPIGLTRDSEDWGVLFKLDWALP